MIKDNKIVDIKHHSFIMNSFRNYVNIQHPHYSLVVKNYIIEGFAKHKPVSVILS
jgi:hypothetical protein